MNRFNPTFRPTVVGQSTVVIYEPVAGAPFMPAVIHNRGNVPVRITIAEIPDDAEDYQILNAGKTAETNPDIKLYCYAPEGSALVMVTMGFRPTGDMGIDAQLAQSSADLLRTGVSQEELLAMITLQLGVGLRYLAEWEGEELKETDALKI